MPSRQLIGVAAAALLAACGTSPASPSGPVASSGPPSPAPTQPATAPTPATLAPAVTPSPADPWLDAGSMAVGRHTPHAIPLGDGRVLVVGNDEIGCVRGDSASAELWDPASNAWMPTASLNKPRAEFAAVALADGRAMVIGGVNESYQAFSSTYVFDSEAEPAGWTEHGQLGTARAAPAAAVLADGRVLVAGGVFINRGAALAEPACGATLVVYRPQPAAAPAAEPPPADVDPRRPIPVLATAELFDPAAGTWAKTGPMRHPRVGATAVTLADGRVLIVGSREGSGWNYTYPLVPDRAFVTAEIYDPRSGRFSMAGRFPGVDWGPIADLDPDHSEAIWTIDPPVQLVALGDGDALLVDRPVEWHAGEGAGQLEGRIVRLLRFDARTGDWSVVDQRMTGHNPAGSTPEPMRELMAGHVRDGAIATRLVDGRILFAGGIDPVTVEPSTAADLYDPVANTWLALPPMPKSRAYGAAAVLDDGSVLMVGGDGRFDDCDLETCECGEGTTGVASAVRFAP